MPQLKLKKSHRRRPTAAIVITLTLALLLVGAVWFALDQSPQTRSEAIALIQADDQPAPQASTPDVQLPSPSLQLGNAEPAGAVIEPVANRAAVPAGLDATALSQAKQLTDAGQLVQARTLLNDQLVAGDLSDADAKTLKLAIAPLQDTLILSPKIDVADPLVDTIVVPSGGALAKLARPFDVPWQGLARINNIDNPNRIRVGQKLKALRGPFHAVVDKSDFTIDLYLGAAGGSGSTYVTTRRVGLGESSSTPTGLWKCTTSKVENPKWTNPRTGEVVAADDPQNPLGERWIGLEGIEGDAVGQQSYGIHGTIEPQTIGTNASMGCIRLLEADVELIYDLLEPGASTVRIVE